MVWFYARGQERRSCETRLAAVPGGYELVIREAQTTSVESFTDLRKLLSREHQLLTAWKAQGWKNAEAAFASLRFGAGQF
jgi:hypothetical protein